MMDLDIFGTVKDIVANQIQMVNGNVFAIHAKIVTVGLDVVDLDILTVPKGFFGVRKVVVIQCDVTAAPENFGCLNRTVVDFNVVSVPDS